MVQQEEANEGRHLSLRDIPTVQILQGSFL